MRSCYRYPRVHQPAEAMTILEVLNLGADAVLEIDDGEQTLNPVEILMEQYYRAGFMEEALKFARQTPRSRFVVLRGVAKIAEYFVAQSQFEKARQVVELIRDLKANGASDFVNHVQDITEAVSMALCKEGNFDAANEAIRTMYDQEGLLADVCVQAIRQGFVTRGIEMMNSLGGECVFRKSLTLAPAFAKAGEFQMALEQLKKYRNSNFHHKAVRRTSRELCLRRDFDDLLELVNFVVSVWPRASHAFHHSRIVEWLSEERFKDDTEAVELRTRLADQFIQEYLSGKELSFLYASRLVGHLMHTGDDAMVCKFTKRAYSVSADDTLGNPSVFSLRRAIRKSTAEWLEQGNPERFNEFVEGLEPGLVRFGFLADSISYEMNDKPIEIESWMRKCVANGLLAFEISPKAAREYIADYDLFKLLKQLGMLDEAAKLINDHYADRNDLKDDIGAALLATRGDQETLKFVSVWLNGLEPDSQHLAKTFVEMLNAGLHDEAASYATSIPKDRHYRFMETAMAYAMDKPCFETFCELYKKFKVFQFDDSVYYNLTRELEALEPLRRLEVLKSLEKHGHKNDWTQNQTAYTHAELGRIAESLPRPIAVDRKNGNSYTLNEFSERAISCGHREELLKAANTLSASVERSVLIRHVCPDLAKTNESEAIQLAKQIEAPRERALAFGDIAKVVIDGRQPDIEH